MMENIASNVRQHKSSKTRRENAVQGTNDNSIVSKCSMANVGYFRDEYLHYFVSKLCRRAPLIHRGYYIRATTIDFLLKKFLEEHKGRKQILSLGAGFDSAYFRLKADGLLEETVFCEIDFPDVVKRKQALIQSQSVLSDLIGQLIHTCSAASPLIEISTDTYKLLGVDLTQLTTLEALLRLCGLDFETPTLLLSECVLTYMTRRCSSAVVSWAAETFVNAVFVIYEQINPDDAFGLFMQSHFQQIGSPLKCINAFPTLQSQKERFLRLGWMDCEALDMNQFYNSLVPEDERKRIEKLEPFDEYEEWHLKCSHYMVLCAYTGKCKKLLQCLKYETKGIESSVHDLPHVDILPCDEGVSDPVKRFGHSTTLLDGNAITVGGFGEQGGKHQRLVEIAVTNTVTMETVVIRPDVDIREMEVGRMHPTVSSLVDGTILLIGGRVSPLKLCSQLVQLKVGLDMQTTCHNNFICSYCLKMRDIQGNKTNCGQTDIDMDVPVNKADDGYFCDKNLPDIRTENMSVENISETSVKQPKSTSDFTISSGKTIASVDTCQTCSKCQRIVSKQNISSGNVSSNKTLSDHDVNPCEEDDVSRKHSTDLDLTEKISCVECTILQQYGEIPCPRWRHTSVVMDKGGQEVIITYGGRSKTELALADCHMLDPTTNYWNKVQCKGTGPGPCQSHTACVWGSQMVIAGGLDCHLQPLDTVYLMDIISLTWEKLTIIGTLLPRSSHTAHVVGNLLVLVGGVNLSNCPPGVAIINLISGHSIEFPLPQSDRSRLTMLHCHTSVLTKEGRILIIGGGGNCFSFGTHLNNSPLLLDISRCMTYYKTKMDYS